MTTAGQKSTEPSFCPICEKDMDKKRRPWLFYCRECDLWKSSLDTHDEKKDLIYSVDEEAFKQLRIINSGEIFEALSRLGTLEGLTLLDVGCSYGWFMEEARVRGIIPFGLDPQQEKAQRAIDKGLDIKIGYFPEDMETSKRYDIVTFNDVLEHFRDVDRVINSSGEFLGSRGKLVICFPDSHGFYYRLSLFLVRMGWKTPLDRLWQKGYPSPHLYYFSSDSLERLVSRHGFTLVADREIQSSTIKGLWERIHVDKKRPTPFSVFLYVSALMLNLVLLKLFKSDSRLHIYQKLPG